MDELERTTDWDENNLSLKNCRYSIKKKLGEGYVCITYLAEDTELKKNIVIKTLKDRVFIERDDALSINSKLKEEAKRLYELTSNLEKTNNICNHIVKYIETFSIKLRFFDDLPCIVMEYIDGQTLNKLVEEQGILKETKALNYIRQIGEALTFVHHNKLLHRDITPQNIIIRNDLDIAVLIDFGLARVFPNPIQNYTVGFTPGYAPPEQYNRQYKLGTYTDVYSLAATLYYLLTGHKPPDAPSRQETNYLLEEPQKIIPDISDKVNQAILAGMKLQSDERPETVQEWLELLGVEQVKHTKPEPTSEQVKHTEPELTYGLVVGIEKYEEAAWNIKGGGPVKNALEFASWLCQRGVPKDNIRLCLSPIQENRHLVEQFEVEVELATQQNIYHIITNFLSQQQGDLLFIFWSGHGLTTPKRERRLICADATKVDYKNIDLDSLLTCLTSDAFRIQKHICIVDIDTSYHYEVERLPNNLTEKRFSLGQRSQDSQQFVFFSIKEGEQSKISMKDNTEYLSQSIMQALEQEHLSFWPPNMEVFADKFKQQFKNLDNKQMPTYFYCRRWNGDIEVYYSLLR